MLKLGFVQESWQYPCNILFVVVGTTFYMSMVFVFSTKAKESIFCNAVYVLVDGSRQKHGKIINQSINHHMTHGVQLHIHHQKGQ
jgi:hypothetical protein